MLIFIAFIIYSSSVFGDGTNSDILQRSAEFNFIIHKIRASENLLDKRKSVEDGEERLKEISRILYGQRDMYTEIGIEREMSRLGMLIQNAQKKMSQVKHTLDKAIGIDGKIKVPGTVNIKKSDDEEKNIRMLRGEDMADSTHLDSTLLNHIKMLEVLLNGVPEEEVLLAALDLERSFSKSRMVISMRPISKIVVTFLIIIVICCWSFRENLFALYLTLKNIANYVKTEKDNSVLVSKSSESEVGDVDIIPYISGVGYKVRSPLNSILGICEILIGSEITPKQKSYVESIEENAELLNIIIADLIEYAKLESGEITLFSNNFGPQREFADEMKKFAIQAKEKGIEFHLSFSKNFPKQIVTDKYRLLHIVSNIVSNAIRYTFQGSVQVRVFFEGHTDNLGELSIYVQDTGIGISEERMKMIFRPAHGENIENVESGLGLAIGKKTLEKMGGMLALESDLGKGTTATLKLMVEIVEKEVTELHFDRGEFSILVVDDDPISRKLVVRYLESANFKVDTAVDGVAAVEMAKQNDYNLILMDIMMPRKNGLDASREILKNCERNLPFIVALTAKDSKNDITKMKEVGITEFMQKPVKKEILYKTIKELSIASKKSA